MTHSPGRSAADDEQFLLTDLVHAVLGRREGTGWMFSSDGIWSHVQPPAFEPRVQGWKLHLSATPLSAPTVLARAAQVLIDGGCAFKFAASLRDVAALTASRCERAAAGKFITAYPDDDEHFRELAAALHRRTYGLPGPVILSDRPFAPGSLVHYRYGAILGVPVLNNDGSLERRLRTPTGTLVPDSRTAWFDPPSWAEDPLLGTTPAAPAGPAGPVLLGRRFLVHRAIRHANRGGVYRAVDEHTGLEVVVKHARRHVGAAPDGSDVRDLLRREAAMLDRLAPRDVAPRKVALVEHGSDLFLAEEAVDGVTLEAFVVDRVEGDRGLPRELALELARRLLDLLGTLQEEGLVDCDLNPTNVMITPGGELRLVDLEALVEPGTPVVAMFTPAYAAPEQLGMPELGPAPAPPVNLYALGATLFFLVSGCHPVLADDQPTSRPVHERLAAWLRELASDNRSAHELAPLVLGLLHDQPDRRWSVDRAREFLDRVRATAAPAAPLPAWRLQVPIERLLSDGLDHVLDGMVPEDGEHLWPAPRVTEDCDPCAVQHGASGVLAVLVRAAQVRDDPRLPEAVRGAATWTWQKLRSAPRLLPGLYFGHSGAAWALHEAGGLLGDAQLRADAAGLARKLPLPWPNPDVCHGTAGAGMAQLYFLQSTGAAEFAERSRLCADALLAAAERRAEGVVWPVPATFDSALRGITHSGFAHGVAGVGAFLLSAGASLGRADYVACAREAGRLLAAVAQVEEGAARWPSGEEGGDRRPARLTHWCSGSSGIGTFLIRLWRVTGDPELLVLVDQAATAVRRDRWNSSTVACHGLAGDGEFLLDLADVLDEPRYRRWAEELVSCLGARNVLRHGRMLLPDESGLEVTLGYGTGLAGILAFLLRLRHGSPRPWMPAPGDRTSASQDRDLSAVSI